jgi:hypothetical protein
VLAYHIYGLGFKPQYDKKEKKEEEEKERERERGRVSRKLKLLL